MRSEADVKRAFQKQHGYLPDDEVSRVYEVALKTYLDLAFPFDHSITSIPADRPRGYVWVYECMGEIMERSGCQSMKSYSENGLSITWDNSGVSKNLLNRLMPKVGVL